MVREIYFSFPIISKETAFLLQGMFETNLVAKDVSIKNSYTEIP